MRIFLYVIAVAFLMSPVGIFLTFLMDVGYIFGITDLNLLLVMGNMAAILRFA